MSIAYSFLNRDRSLVIKTCSGQAHSTKRHVHSALSIAIVNEGETDLKISKRNLRMHSKQLILIPAYFSHECKPVDPVCWRCTVLYVGAGSASCLDGSHERVTVCDLADEEYAAVMNDIDDVGEGRRGLTGATFMSRLGAVLSRCVRITTIELVKEDARVDLIRHYIEEHYLEELSLNALANISGMNKYHMIKCFNSAYNISPLAYQKCLRIEHARAQIHESNKLCDLALEYSFYDQPHFSRLFKRVYGITPAQYRRLQATPISYKT